MTVAGQRVGSARRFYDDGGPDQAGLDMHRRNFLDADADLITAEPRPFAAQHGPVGHFNDSGKKMIALCPSARLECLRCHMITLATVEQLSTDVVI
jgi:hypothetical protein